MSAACQVIEVNFRPKAEPEPATGDEHIGDVWQEGDPIPPGYETYKSALGGLRLCLAPVPYEQTPSGRLDVLEDQVASLRRRLAVAERKAGAR